MNEAIAELVNTTFGCLAAGIEKLPKSGSIRTYYRVYLSNGLSVIATYNQNIKENQTFIAFSRHFRQKNLPVSEILAVNEEQTLYLQSDLGFVSLLDILDKEGYTKRLKDLFKKSLFRLVQMQINGHEGLNYNLCLTAKEFGKQAIMSDLLYFKYYFLDTLQLPYDKQALMDDFETLSNFLTDTEHKYFMFRDFQSRNIIVKDDEVYFIDYQGGMQGALHYDVASLLWQAKARLSDDWKTELLNYYIAAVQQVAGIQINSERFTNRYNGYVLIRLMQVLGAYGFRGLFERKAHFLTSIPLALINLRRFIKEYSLGIEMNVFTDLLYTITDKEIIQRFQPVQANNETPLLITINSFSYKNSLPEDISGNGGGFMFDCRGILNPGRFAEFKTSTGLDKNVTDFLQQQTRMDDFINSIFDIVDITVEDYINRGFTSLMISFGCTGGQHRSVYAAEQTAHHLRNKFNVKTQLYHLNKANWVKQLAVTQKD